MALFGKKAKDPASPSTQAEANGAAAVATDPGVQAPAQGKKLKVPKLGKPGKPATPGKPAKAGKPSRASHGKTLKNGTVVGLNVGNSLIKAVEITCKNGELSVTAMGAVATPPDCISNGVVISIGALSDALKGLWRSAGIRSRNVVTSVAGTGALVVRVIEVPKMTDNELRDNMKVDADRYIPFPPSEVVMDFKALRDLPTDPDAPNMEVLLAAAQREIIDHHLKALQSSRLDPRAIDVEPIAAVRALELARTRATGDNYVDYNDVSAVVNIGATGTEISVLRGDIVVFTRSVPTGGNTITQAIVDNLEMEFHEAERVKIEVADALPPHGVDLAAPQQQDEFDAAFGADFGGFGSQDDTEAIPFDQFGGAATGGDLLNLGPDDGDSPTAALSDPFAAATFGASAFTAPPPAGTAQGAPPAGPTSDDPFDLDFFNQGPKQNEPGSGHGQSEGGGFSFSFEGDPKPEAAPAAPRPAPAPPEPPAETPETPHQGGAFTFNFDDATTTSTTFLPTLEERKVVIEPRPPVEPTAEELLPTLVPVRRPENLATPPVVPVVAYSAPSEWDDSSLLPTVDTAPAAPEEADPTGSELLPTLISPAAPPARAASPAAPAPPLVAPSPLAATPAPQPGVGPVPSAFEFDDQDLPTVSLEEAAIPAPLIPGLLAETQAAAMADTDSPTEFFGGPPAPTAPVAPPAPAPRGFAFSEPVEAFLPPPVATPTPVAPAAPAPSGFNMAPAEGGETSDFESPTQPLSFEGIGALSAARPTAPRQETETVPSVGDTEIIGGHFESPTHSLASAATASDDFDLDAIFGASAPGATQAAPDLGETAAFGAPAAGLVAGFGSAGLAGTGLADALGGLTADAGGFDLSGLEAGEEGGFGGADLGSFGVGLSSDEGVGSVDAGHLYNILHPVLEELVNEVRRSLEYHLSRYPDAAISRIVLIGGGAGLLNLDVFFTQMLGIPTEVSNPFANISLNAPKLPPDYALDNGAICTVALGLALRDFVQ